MGMAMNLPAGLPPGPGLPGWQLAKMWIEQPVQLWEECASRYRDTFTIELGKLGTTVLFSHPEAVRQIFQLSSSTFTCGQYNEHYKYVMGARSVLLNDGPGHLRARKQLMPPLHRRLVERHGEAIRALAREAVESWPADRPFSPRPAMHLFSLKLILRIFFGTADEGPGPAIARIFEEEIYRDLSSWGPWTRFGHLQPRLREMIDEEVRRRRAHPDPSGMTVLDALVQARGESGEPLEDEEVQDHLFTMLVGGADPTALALSWALYWIHENPDVLARLQDELGPSLETGRLVELPYLNAVCQETLRMYPVVTTPSGRKLLAAVSIQGRQFEPGITLLPCTYLVHRRPDLYPEPARFRPERFLERQYAAHEYFPFGGGARTCVGATLGPVEMKLALAEILARCRLVPAHDGPVHPTRHGTLLAPSNAMKFLLASRTESPGDDGP
jgi:cytochrome P450 family 110